MLRRVATNPATEPLAAKKAFPLRFAQNMRTALLPLVALALLGFAANSLLCRLALAPPARIDALSFTALRLLSGSVVLLAAAGLRRARAGASLRGALALGVYMLAFSLSYVRIGAALGALLLFGAVQATMLSVALLRGERIDARTVAGLLAALLGLGWLLAPGVAAAEPWGSALMLAAGGAWGVYSLLGRQSRDALGTTAGNFAAATLLLLSVGLCALLAARLWSTGPLLAYLPSGASLPGLAAGSGTWFGAGLAITSGSLASGLGYALWYRALPTLGATRAAIVQLLVPVLAAALAVPLLGETLHLRLLLSAGLVLSGVALALLRPSR